jgi:membrane-associated protease RseP (regulator of RpoE activity)
MKSSTYVLTHAARFGAAIAIVLVASQFIAAAQDETNQPRAISVVTATGSDTTAEAVSNAGSGDKQVVVKVVEPDGEADSAARKDRPWLGLATEEAPEVLGSQLGLEAGAGLVVTFVTPDSPAAKAGLQKNDLLVEFEGQSLVHPAQLRKLVWVRKAGTPVKLAFYRAGKKQTVSATLGGTPPNHWREAKGDLEKGLGELRLNFQDLPVKDALHDQMKALREYLGTLKIDQEKVRDEVRRGMETARKSLEEALRDTTNADAALGPVRKLLDDLAHSSVHVDNDASVTVRSTGKTVRSSVTSDDSGTIVLVADPKLHLTVHDKNGGLIFDGPIDTQDQKDKVPRDLWRKVEPLLDKMDGAKKAEVDYNEQ